jgi:hypothetical protein
MLFFKGVEKRMKPCLLILCLSLPLCATTADDLPACLANPEKPKSDWPVSGIALHSIVCRGTDLGIAPPARVSVYRTPEHRVRMSGELIPRPAIQIPIN